MNPKKRKYRFLKYIAYICIVFGLAIAILWLAFQHTPKAYSPMPSENPEQVSLYLTHKLGPDFFNQVQLGRPFELIIEQDGLNDIIRQGIWPQECGPATVDTPVVVFDKGTIYAMSRVGYLGLSSVLTVVAKPTQDPNGLVNMNIVSVRLGLLPVTTLAAHIAEMTMQQYQADLAEWPELETAIRGVITNTAFEPVFDFSGDPVRVEKFELEQGRLRLRLKPLDKSSSSCRI